MFLLRSGIVIGLVGVVVCNLLCFVLVDVVGNWVWMICVRLLGRCLVFMVLLSVLCMLVVWVGD